MKSNAFCRRLVVLVVVAAEARAQSPTLGELEKRLEEMRSQMASMQNQLAELEAATKAAATRAVPDPVGQRGTLPASTSRGVAKEEQSREAPNSIRYKGVSLTPGGFLEGTTLFRTRNENADIANNYSALPLDGSSNAQLSEFRGTARNSEFSLLIEGTAASTRLKGFVETDFLGAAPTANYVESNSWTPRLRQLWVQLDWPSGWTMTTGQMWSLLTTNRHGIATLAELRPGVEDGQYVVGFAWARQRAFRVTKILNNKVSTAFAIESPETT